MWLHKKFKWNWPTIFVTVQHRHPEKIFTLLDSIVADKRRGRFVEKLVSAWLAQEICCVV